MLEVPEGHTARHLRLSRVTAVWIVRLLCDKTFHWRDRGILDCAYSARRPSTLSVPSGGFGVRNRGFIGLVSSVWRRAGFPIRKPSPTRLRKGQRTLAVELEPFEIHYLSCGEFSEPSRSLCDCLRLISTSLPSIRVNLKTLLCKGTYSCRARQNISSDALSVLQPATVSPV